MYISTINGKNEEERKEEKETNKHITCTGNILYTNNSFTSLEK